MEELTGFLGTWTGPNDQAGVGPYTIELTIEANAAGRLAGRVRYPELDNCSGYLTNFQHLGTTEYVTSGARCVDVVSLELTLDGKKLRYQGLDRELSGELTKK